MSSISNPYSFYNSVVISLLIGNIQTIKTQASTLDILTDTSESLSKAWTSAPSADNPAYQALQGVSSSSDMQSYINQWLTAGVYTNPTTGAQTPFIDLFSSTLGIDVMNTLSQNWDTSSGSPSPGLMTLVNQWISLISSTSQNEESIGQNLVKTESSVIQQGAGAQQGFADMGNSVNGIAGNYASLLQQAY